MDILENYSLIKHNTFGINANARYFFQYDNIFDLKNFLLNNSHKSKPLLHIGMGSNLLFTGNFDGVILHSKICFYDIVNQNNLYIVIRVGSGIVWDDFCFNMAKKGLGGIENLSNIPGEVGASAIQNIGAYGVEVADVISKVETVETSSGKDKIFDVADCQYGYRDSIFKNSLKNKYIVTAVEFILSKKPELKLDYGNLKNQLANIEEPTVNDVRNAVIEARKTKLPDYNVLGNAGSFFKNPIIEKRKFYDLKNKYEDIPYFYLNNNLVKIPAAWLIEKCGLKGKMVGGAAVYEKQPLVLVNKNNATAKDICQLADLVCKLIFEKFSIKIEPEVNYI